MRNIRKEFDEYFLRGQEGEGAILVVYDDEEIALQSMNRSYGFSAVNQGINNLDEDQKRIFEKIRKPESKKGINPELTALIEEFYRQISMDIEESELGDMKDIKESVEQRNSNQLELKF